MTLFIAGYPLPNLPTTTDYPKPERLLRGNPRRLTTPCWEQGPLSAGIWECEVGAWRIAFAQNKQEFFHVLQGRVRLQADNGASCDIGPGSSAIIPPGFTGIFEVLEPVRKHYVIVEN